MCANLVFTALNEATARFIESLSYFFKNHLVCPILTEITRELKYFLLSINQKPLLLSFHSVMFPDRLFIYSAAVKERMELRVSAEKLRVTTA